MPKFITVDGNININNRITTTKFGYIKNPKNSTCPISYDDFNPNYDDFIDNVDSIKYLTKSVNPILINFLYCPLVRGWAQASFL